MTLWLAISLCCFALAVYVSSKSWKTLLIAITSLICFTAIFFVFAALTFVSNLQVGEPMAGVMTVFLVPACFPLLVAAGYLFRRISEWLLRRKLPGRDFLPWLLPIVIGVGGVAVELAQSTNAATFHKFVADDMPGSIAGYHYWRRQQIDGDRIVVISFRLDPAEFDKLLSRRQFDATSDPQLIQTAIQRYSEYSQECGLENYRISLPKQGVVRMYWYSHEEDGVPCFRDVFTNKSRDEVLIYGGN
jgi:hypothetical protein